MRYNQFKKAIATFGLGFLFLLVFIGESKAQNRNLRLVFSMGFYMDTVTVIRDYGHYERDTIVNNVIISSKSSTMVAKDFKFDYSKEKAKGFVAVIIIINDEKLGEFQFRSLKRNAAIEINLMRLISVRYAMLNEEFRKELSPDELKYLNTYLPKSLWYRLAQNGKFRY